MIPEWNKISEKYSSIIVTSGETDQVVRSMSYKEVAGGHQWMAYITGMGCALSATIGAFISTSNDPLKATVDALTLWGIAAKHAHRASNGPREPLLETFWTACINSLKNQFPELEICINSAAMYQFPNSSLYLVINPEQCKFGSVVETALNAVKGGVTTIQIRSKTMNDQDFVETTANLVRELACFHVPVIVNDRVEAVTAANASGVHLGQEDASVTDARDTLGKQRIIGLTVRSLEEANNAPLDLIDYISIGGVFRTTSKENHDPPIGTG